MEVSKNIHHNLNGGRDYPSIVKDTISTLTSSKENHINEELPYRYINFLIDVFAIHDSELLYTEFHLDNEKELDGAKKIVSTMFLNLINKNILGVLEIECIIAYYGLDGENPRSITDLAENFSMERNIFDDCFHNMIRRIPTKPSPLDSLITFHSNPKFQ